MTLIEKCVVGTTIIMLIVAALFVGSTVGTLFALYGG